jgi:hypothetical protein
MMKARSRRLQWFSALYFLSLTAFVLAAFAIHAVLKLLA